MSNEAIEAWDEEEQTNPSPKKVIKIEGVDETKWPHVILERYMVTSNKPIKAKMLDKKCEIRDDRKAIVVEDGCEFIMQLDKTNILCTAKHKPTEETLYKLSKLIRANRPPVLTTTDEPYQYVVGGNFGKQVDLENIARFYEASTNEDGTIDFKNQDGFYVTLGKTGAYVLDGPADTRAISFTAGTLFVMLQAASICSELA